ANCREYVAQYSSSVTDIFRSVAFTGDLVITASGDKCILQSNGVPNHDFNDGNTGFPNNLSPQTQYYEINAEPVFAASPTYLRIGTDNGLMLNGVKIDLLAAACFGVGNERTGCMDMSNPWRFDPMHPANGFRVDSHNAHVQPNGSYHYHGSPNAMFETESPIISPIIGFAADGFPIYGSWFDDNGTVRKAESSYRLKTGTRAAVDGYETPPGNYDGQFRQDYEYVIGFGDLDECNGMTVDGAYGYYITDRFPYVLACLKGSSDATFE
ncbi:MAG: YHYH protein, partial [Porticoccaceae bacterium]|nr:YHYH protein [Porticoccaceae bacterium]